MPTWMGDASAMQSNGAPFDSPLDNNPNVLDPSMAFMPSSNSFDLQSFPNTQLQQRMSNGSMRNTSPAFQNPSYQVPPSVPAKRPRPREDSLGASPRQTPGALPNSRSHTPQQVPFQGFPTGQHAPQPFSQPNPYQHLQHGGSTNASPSPIMQNQQYRGSAGPQRVQTASPSPFPSMQGFTSQMSPAHSDHASRVNTPQNNPSIYMQSLQYGPGFNQNFTPPPGMTPGSQQPLSGPPVQPHDMARNYQMQLQQQRQAIIQANSIKAQGLQQVGGLSMMANQPGQNPNAPLNVNPMRPQQPITRPGHPDGFLKALAQFMSSRGQQIDAQPMVGDRRIHLMQLYTSVMKRGGSKKVSQNNAWMAVAADLQIPADGQYRNSSETIKNIYGKNLAAYEEAYIQSQSQRQRLMGAQSGNTMVQQRLQPGAVGINPQLVSPIKQGSAPFQAQGPLAFPQQVQTPQAPQLTPAKPSTPGQGDERSGHMNGFATPQQNALHARQHSAFNQTQSSAPRPMNATPPQNQQSGFPTPSPASAGKQSSIPNLESPQTQFDGQIAPSVKKPPPLNPNFQPKARMLDTHGGINVSVLSGIGAEVTHYKPDIPDFLELGVIDIHALTRSLQSGIHAEVRLALDTLATLSGSSDAIRTKFQLQLQHCEDLVQTLIDCAELQVDALAEDASEVSDEILISSYEDVIRGCRSEVETLQDVPSFGTNEYELDRAVERLICITTILRNLSFFDDNHKVLADPIVVKFLSTVIRYLGTRNMLLRTNANTLDFMKDIIIYLSNLGHWIQLPSKDEALALLHFLLAFAPCPPPTLQGNDKIMFSPYQPSIHRYLLLAVDSLAQLLARDEPNRTFYKTLFLADGASLIPYDLLTRTFALAISPVPEHTKGNLIPIVEARKPYLLQGMLAAEILANLAPGYESGLARSWLSSEDGFAPSLLRLVCLLSMDRAPPARHPSGRVHDPDAQSFIPIVHRGMAVLRKLAEKAQDPENNELKLPVGVLPKKESLLGALLTPSIDTQLLRQLCAFDGLES
ncbi:MAG: hypothetical protein M1824_002395 [Vezdaea acicularis]|nr:MAG: hypothetical protein M1824_002395 [Vezdaea acicularis]